MRLLFRFGAWFIGELAAGNPYAIGVSALLGLTVVITALIKFAKQPLGGDPDTPSISDKTFQDDKNPYQNL